MEGWGTGGLCNYNARKIIWLASKGICHPSVHAQQFDFLSDGTFFKVDIRERMILFHRPYEACEIVIRILKNCLVNHDRFKRHILGLELKTFEKIRCRQKRIFKATRDESYLQLVFLEER